MKKMRPVYTFLFAVAILFCLFFITLIFPEKGVPFINGDTLHMPRVADLVHKDTRTYVNIEEIVGDQLIPAISDTLPIDTVVDKEVKDTLVKEVIKVANADNLRSSYTGIEYPPGNDRVLFPAFQSMATAKNNGKLARVLHFGDSQIEGDRISSYIRVKLQDRFGGVGAGLIPPVQAHNYHFPYVHEVSGNWKRWSSFPSLSKEIPHRRYGIMSSFSRFSNYVENDSLINDDEIHEAWISFRPSSRTYSRTKQFYQLRLFYGYNKKPMIMELDVNGSQFDADIIPPSGNLETLRWTFDQSPSSVKLVFKGADSPDFFALAFDGHSGVALDNIPLRGSSGLEFTKVDRQLLGQLINQLNVKMIIMQFGGNVVPYIDQFPDFEKIFYAQLLTIKRINSDIPILVVGPGDMAINQNGRPVSHPGVPKVIAALKRATFRAGAAYWDMYQAMGGNNSMVSWVNANPPLASADYVHFNHRGAKLVAEMLYTALDFEINKYLKEQGVNE